MTLKRIGIERVSGETAMPCIKLAAIPFLFMAPLIGAATGHARTAAAAASCLNLGDPALALPPAAARLPNPLVFVTQLPLSSDLKVRFSPFGNHLGNVASAGRGGDLWIVYPPDAAQGIPQGCLRNLTREAGLGEAGEMQLGTAPIAVREPSVHWNGQRLLVSIVSGAPTSAIDPRFFWQIYEVSGIGIAQSPVFTRVPGQPEQFNNVSPVYGADEDQIIFTSDLPRSGAQAMHLYPQQDEYERTETVTGLWSLQRSTGEIALLSHAPSGTFSPLVDSLGRVLVSRWDHLQRDIFATQAIQFASESPAATQVPMREVFPEPLPGAPELPDYTHPDYGSINGFNFKHFFLWHSNGDGSGEEIVNHLGRHELVHFFHRSFERPGNGLVAHSNPRPREVTVENMLQVHEDPGQPFRYVFTDAPHFLKQSAGRLLVLSAPPGVSGDALALQNLTAPRALDPADATFTGDRFRDPAVLSNGLLVASHANACGPGPVCSDDTRDLDPDPERFNPNYRFALRVVEDGNGDGFIDAGARITPSISRRLRAWSVVQDQLMRFDGEMSQLDAAEIRPRPRPPVTQAEPLPSPEAQILAEESVSESWLHDFLRARDLALIVVRDVTARDRHDRQQPFNLRVPGSTVVSDTGIGQIYDVEYLQVLQADLVSGHIFRSGRRPLARPLNGTGVLAAKPPLQTSLTDADIINSSFRIALEDGSAAAAVPARRALSWQLNDPAGYPLVRERYWLTLQPGEIRVCTSCHGPNSTDQLGRPPPTHSPEALRVLIRHFKQWEGVMFASGFE
jgi:hypothetical protein